MIPRGGFYLFAGQRRHGFLACQPIHGQAVLLLVSPDGSDGFHACNTVNFAAIIACRIQHVLDPPDTVTPAAIADRSIRRCVGAILPGYPTVGVERGCAVDPPDAGIALDGFIPPPFGGGRPAVDVCVAVVSPTVQPDPVDAQILCGILCKRQ